MSGFGLPIRREASCPPSTVGMLRHPMEDTPAALDQANTKGNSTRSLQTRSAETTSGDRLMAQVPPRDHHLAELSGISEYQPASTDPPAQFKPGSGLRASRARSARSSFN
jgi:hypothetical protein